MVKNKENKKKSWQENILLYIIVSVVIIIIGGLLLKVINPKKNEPKVKIKNSKLDKSPVVVDSPGAVVAENIVVNSRKENKPNYSENMPILIVKSISFKPYAPSPPEVPGQFKAKIVVKLILKNDKIANNVRIKFDIDDGAGRRVNSEEWDAIARQKPLIFSMTYLEAKDATWTPDIPNGINEIAQNRAQPFILRLLITWENIQGDQYKLVSYSELRYNENTNMYVFDERES